MQSVWKSAYLWLLGEENEELLVLLYAEDEVGDDFGLTQDLSLDREGKVHSLRERRDYT